MFWKWLKPNPVSRITRAFCFIEDDWGYKAQPLIVSDEIEGGHLLVYTHFDFKKRIEIAFGSSNFQVIIRRVVNGSPSPYDHPNDWVDLNALITLLSQSLNKLNKSLGRSFSLKKAISAAVKDLEKNAALFTSSDWTPFDRSGGRFVDLLKYSLGIDLDKPDEVPFMQGTPDVLRELNADWVLSQNSDQLAPYHVNRSPAFAVYQLESDLLEIREMEDDSADGEVQHVILLNGVQLGIVEGETKTSFEVFKALLSSK